MKWRYRMGWFQRVSERAEARIQYYGAKPEGERYALVLAVALWGWGVAVSVVVFATMMLTR